MKTIREYEEQDIDLSNDLHSLLALGLIVGALSFSGKKDTSPEKLDSLQKNAVANFLNLLDKGNYTIVPKDVPKVFLDITSLGDTTIS